MRDDERAPAEAIGQAAGTPSDPEEEVLREETPLEVVESSPSWATPPDRDRDLHGIVWGPDRKPFPGAEIVVWRPALQGMRTIDRDWKSAVEKVASTVSNGDGEFRIRLEPGSLYDLDVSAEGLGARLRRRCVAGERVIVRLEAYAAISGTVTEAETGAPVVGVPIRVSAPGTLGRTIEVMTDVEGHYVADSLVQGIWYLELNPQALSRPGLTVVTLEESEQRTLDFALPRGRTARGRVVDATTGRAIADAEVSDSPLFRRSVRTDADGQYELMGAGGGFGQADMCARAPGYGMLKTPVQPKETEFECDFELIPARTAVGQVLLPDGELAVGAFVAAVASTASGPAKQSDWRSTLSKADGTFEIDGLRADLPHTLLIRMLGYGTLIYEFPTWEFERERVDLGVFTLSHGGWISGIVRGKSGEGLRSKNLVLKGWNLDRGRFSDARNQDLDTFLSVTEVRSDDLGRFRFADLSPGSYTLLVRRVGGDQVHPDPLVVYAGEGIEGIEFLQPPGGVIAGIVLGLDGLAAPDALVSLHFKSNGEDRNWMRGVDAEGRFRFEDLGPASYRVVAIPPITGFGAGRTGTEDRIQAMRAGVHPGETDLRLQMSSQGFIGGMVVDALGAPVSAAPVCAYSGQGVLLDSQLSMESGMFHLTLPEGELVTVVAIPPVQGTGEGGGEVGAYLEEHPNGARQSAVTVTAYNVRLQLQWEPDS